MNRHFSVSILIVRMSTSREFMVARLLLSAVLLIPRRTNENNSVECARGTRSSVNEFENIPFREEDLWHPIARL